MSYLKKTIIAGILCVFVSFTVKAQLVNPYYSDNDNVAFVGNSITRNGEFYTIVSLYQATRFPHQKVKINNYGCGGNKVIDVVERINGDVLEFNPNCISMMLGMNDVGGNYYAVSLLVNGSYSASTLASQQTAKNTYYAGMKGLINTFKGKGIKVLLQSPTMFDEKLVSTSALDFRNKPLGVFRDSVECWSRQFGLQFVDYYTILNRIDSLEKLKDPTFTIVSSDRIHPQTLGHFVMAYSYLKALGMPSKVSDVELNATDNSISKTDNAVVSAVNLNSTSGGTFKVLAKALPMTTIIGAEKALTWEHFDFYNELNNELLTVKGLLPDKSYSLTISTKFIGNFTGTEFAQGINLAKYATPQRDQAQAISNLLYAKRDQEAKRRAMRSCEFTVLTEQQFATFTPEQKIHKVDSVYAVNPSSLFYFGTYDTDRPNEANIIAQIQSLEQQVVTYQQVKEYVYTIGEKVTVIPSTMVEDFETNPISHWNTNPAVGAVVKAVVANPLIDLNNSSANVLKITKTGSATAASWNNVNSIYYKPVLNKQNSVVELKVLFRASENTPKSSMIQFRGGASASPSIFSQTLNVMDTWQTLSFDFATISAFSTKFNLNKDSIISYIGFFPRADADQLSSVMMYIDDIKVLNKPITSGLYPINSTTTNQVYYDAKGSTIFFKNTAFEDFNVVVYSIAGIECKRVKIKKGTNSLNVTDLKPGMYLVSCFSGNKKYYNTKFNKI
jgi:GDSL-like Lipase/Acylhydrolase family